MSFAATTARFNRACFRQRAQMWPATVTAAAHVDARQALIPLEVAKSPTTLRRVPKEQGVGWVQQAHATFNFPAAGTYQPAIGSEFTIVASETADEVGTSWRCFDLRRANPATGTDHRCVCFRLD